MYILYTPPVPCDSFVNTFHPVKYVVGVHTGAAGDVFAAPDRADVALKGRLSKVDLG